MESVLQSSERATHATVEAVEQKKTPLYILDAAYEDNYHNNGDSVKNNQDACILQQNTLLLPPSNQNIICNQKQSNERSGPPNLSLNLSLGSNYSQVLLSAGKASRNEVYTRQKFSDKKKLLATVQRSLASHRTTQLRLKQEMDSHLRSPSDQIDLEKHRYQTLECERVISQLNRDLIDIQDSLNNLKLEYHSSSRKAQTLRKQASDITSNYYDPSVTRTQLKTSSCQIPPYSSSYYVEANQKHIRPTIAQDIMSRQYYGGGGGLLKRKHSFIGKRPRDHVPLQSVHKSILQKHISHSVTINSHLLYPVYCLCFDKTGKYFVTGADDHLVKLFYLGGTASSSSNFYRRKSTYDVHPRGAILVTTLRGHAGVVTDIDISSDNALLATASEDGTCRVWGLHNGCPVAVLRGHVGGANMVRFVNFCANIIGIIFSKF